MSHRVFGIRHHGPGCARSLVAALTELAPDCVLIEGPPDADDVVALAASPAMRPPVALLVHPLDAPEHAVFHPFAVFSPEWQALRFALARGIPVRFMDLPHAVTAALALRRSAAQGEDADATDDDAKDDGADDARVVGDGLALLARAAGHADPELWWEHEFERRGAHPALFEAIAEALGAVRAEAPPPARLEALREAHMRRTIRAARKAGHERIAVVCGAWHAPVLRELGPAAPDDALLRGLPKTKVAATWIPWTHGRLASETGYGAGVTSPGFYDHVWTTTSQAGVRWVASAARLLREADLPASSAGVIESVRLADSLAALRGHHHAGLDELRDAIVAVLCGGHAEPYALVRSGLEVGEALGAVPDETPTVPIARDLAAQQKSLRIKVSGEAKVLDLDLRRDVDLARSRLFHRLRLLDVPWAARREVRGASGTFHEPWELVWRPEIEVSLVTASVWGNTVATAAAARTRRRAAEFDDLPALTELLDAVLLADLGDAVDAVLDRVDERATLATDARHLMLALPRLARLVRYGDVRGAPGARLDAVFTGLASRALVALPNACAALDDDGADEFARLVRGVDEAFALLERGDARSAWLGALDALATRDAVHALLRGACCRVLLESGELDQEAVAARAQRELSPGVAVETAAAWLQGLLRGSGAVLLRLDGVWRALDAWLVALTSERFATALPLVRRAFADFEPAERARMGGVVAALAGGGGAAVAAESADATLDAERADLVLPVLAQVLGRADDVR